MSSSSSTMVLLLLCTLVSRWMQRINDGSRGAREEPSGEPTGVQVLRHRNTFDTYSLSIYFWTDNRQWGGNSRQKTNCCIQPNAWLQNGSKEAPEGRLVNTKYQEIVHLCHEHLHTKNNNQRINICNEILFWVTFERACRSTGSCYCIWLRSDKQKLDHFWVSALVQEHVSDR